MPMRYPTGKTKHISSQISIDTHTKLRAITQNREITLDLFLRRLCEWAATKTSIELIDIGLNLPIYAHDELGTVESIELDLPK